MSFVKCFGLNSVFGGNPFPKVQPQKLVATKLPSQGQSIYQEDKWSMLNFQSRSSQEDTVYVVRFHTGNIISRPSAVNLCLVSRDGTSILHRIDSVYYHKSPQEQMKEICSVVNSESGAACDLFFSKPQKSAYTGQPVLKERFRADSLDEVVFVGPELGALEGVIVGPESGAWQLNELQVTSSRSKKTHHFRCRDRLGEGGQSARYLYPLAPKSKVYGQDKSSVGFSNPQIQQLSTQFQIQLQNKLDGLEFSFFENRVRIACALLAVSACGVLNIAGSSEAATVFGIYSVVGAAQCLILEQIPQHAVNDWIKMLLPLWTPDQNPESNSNSSKWVTKETRLNNFYFRSFLYSSFLLSSLYLLVNPQVFNSDPTWFLTQTQMSVVGWAGFLHYICCKWFLDAEDALHVARANIRSEKQA